MIVRKKVLGPSCDKDGKEGSEYWWWGLRGGEEERGKRKIYKNQEEARVM